MIVALILAATPAKALDEDAAISVRAGMAFTLLHEVAHGLIDLLELPVLGREEDAADAFATLTLLNRAEASGEDALLVESAYLWLAEADQAWALGDETPYWGEHSTDEQRFYSRALLDGRRRRRGLWRHGGRRWRARGDPRHLRRQI